MLNEKPKHNRRSIRLKDWDYSQAGGYDITICVQNKTCLFGKVENTQMQMNKAGLMINKWWLRLAENNSNVILDEYMVMPNHFHGIILLTESVGADQSVRPMKQNSQSASPDKAVSITSLIQWFKTMTTNEYIRGVKVEKWPSFYQRLWQRNYYEHIVRDEDDLNRIREYIINNPLKWELDEYYRNQNE